MAVSVIRKGAVISKALGRKTQRKFARRRMRQFGFGEKVVAVWREENFNE